MITKLKSFFKKLFNGLDMSWKNVIIFAVIAGAYTGLINSLPFLNFLQSTSFTDIAVTYEWWIFFAVIIVSNCKKPLEAALKVFTFFLISQPLVYLVEVPFKGLGVFAFYNYWFYMTLLTFPGAFVAYYGTHKNNLLSAIIICVATAILSAYVSSIVLVSSFDISSIHYLTLLFCIFQIVIYILYFIKKPALRIFAAVLNVIFLVAFGIKYLNTESQSSFSLPATEQWVAYEIADEDKCHVDLSDTELKIYFKPHANPSKIILTTADGDQLSFDLVLGKEKILTFQNPDGNLTLSSENLEQIEQNLEYITWEDFQYYEPIARPAEDFAIYEIDGGKYNLVLSGRDGDVIESISLKTLSTGETRTLSAQTPEE